MNYPNINIQPGLFHNRALFLPSLLVVCH